MSTGTVPADEFVAPAVVELEAPRPSLMGKILAGYAAWIIWRAQRHDLRRLESMDDRTLADIGVARAEIGHLVRFGRHGA
jgi:uncharacterized protein YjiS (DUF1127 family)